jgi:hypothetical protein
MQCSPTSFREKVISRLLLKSNSVSETDLLLGYLTILLQLRALFVVELGRKTILNVDG